MAKVKDISTNRKGAIAMILEREKLTESQKELLDNYNVVFFLGKFVYKDVIINGKVYGEKSLYAERLLIVDQFTRDGNTTLHYMSLRTRYQTDVSLYFFYLTNSIDQEELDTLNQNSVFMELVAERMQKGQTI